MVWVVSRVILSAKRTQKKYDYDDNDSLKKWNRKELFMVTLGKSHGIIIS